MRACQKPNCATPAAVTVGVRYATKQVVVSGLGAESDRRLLELCDGHARRMTAPVGWTVLDERRPAVTERISFGDPFASAI